MERLLIWPSWAVVNCLFLLFYYPAVGLGKARAWLAEGYRQA